MLGKTITYFVDLMYLVLLLKNVKILIIHNAKINNGNISYKMEIILLNCNTHVQIDNLKTKYEMYFIPFF